MARIRVWMRSGALAATCGLVAFGCTSESRMVRRPAVNDVETAAAKPLSDAQVSNVRLAMARSLEQRGQLGQAREAYQQICQQDPKNAEAAHRLAIVSDRLGKSDEAVEQFKRALKLRPGNPDVFCDLGYCFYLQKRWAEAEMNLKQAVALDPDHARAHNNLALVYANTDRFGEAFEHFAQAGCTPAAAHSNMAFVMTLREEWEAAQDEYQRALASDPSFELAKERLQALHSIVAKVEAANTSPAANGAKDVELTSHRSE